jgi:hypothetical protein
VEADGFDGPVDHWRRLRRAIREDVLHGGYDAARESFTQYYGSKDVDAALLLIPLVGFLPADDPRVAGTVAAIKRELMVDGLVQRYRSREHVDGLPPGEGVFLACSFWLADVLTLSGQVDEARSMFERLLALRNDVGLLAEEYDPRTGRALGNFPQAFSHVGLINTAHNLSLVRGPAEQRASGKATAWNNGTGGGVERSMQSDRRNAMPRGDKSSYTNRQKRQAREIEKSYKARGVSEKAAARRAWATVNKMTGGGRKSGSRVGKPTNKAPARKGGRLGGAAAAKRPAAVRSASAKKAARTRARRGTKRGAGRRRRS